MFLMSLLTPMLVMSSVLGLSSPDWDKPWFCHGLDCPVYTVKEETPNYEVREYQGTYDAYRAVEGWCMVTTALGHHSSYTNSVTSRASVRPLLSFSGAWVSTTEKGFRYSKAVSKGFWKLFKYIGGDNEGEAKIPMTAPVRVSVLPGAGPFCEDEFTISFFVPYEYQSEAPLPSNEAVFLSQSPAFTAYVMSYPGWNSEAKFTQAAAKLFEELEAAGEPVREDMYYTAGYDSPFRLTHRHNEVWLIQKEAGSAAGGSSQAATGTDVDAAIHTVQA